MPDPSTDTPTTESVETAPAVDTPTTESEKPTTTVDTPTTESEKPTTAVDTPADKPADILTPEIKEELERLRKIAEEKAQADVERKAKEEEERRAKLETEARLQEDIAKLKADAEKAKRDLAIAQAGVPQELLALIPTEGYAEFLESENYASVKKALDASKSVNPPTPANDTPPPSPEDKKGTPETPKRFGEIPQTALADLGRALMGI